MSAAKHVVGQTLPNGATITSVEFRTFADHTIEEVHDSSGGSSISAIPAPGTPAAVAQLLQQRLRDALVNNASFLMGEHPGPDAIGIQVTALTRQMDALIRVSINRYETTKGT